jgi:glutamyl-tRNA reductase
MTAIGACPVSVASTAVHFVRDHLRSLQDANVLLVGAGETTELLLRYLKQYVREPLHLVNRSFEKGSALANTFQAIAHEWHWLPSLLEEADVVIAATGSPKPIITKSMIQERVGKQKNKPLYLIDLAVPRDIEPNVSEVPYVSLHCIDDLAAIVAKHRQGREHAANKAREMIRMESSGFMQELASSEHVSRTIRTYRSQIEMICQGELAKAQQQLTLGADATEVLNTFARALTNKLLHTPSVTLRQAGREGRFELLHFAKQLFAVSE